VQRTGYTWRSHERTRLWWVGETGAWDGGIHVLIRRQVQGARSCHWLFGSFRSAYWVNFSQSQATTKGWNNQNYDCYLVSHPAEFLHVSMYSTTLVCLHRCWVEYLWPLLFHSVWKMQNTLTKSSWMWIYVEELQCKYKSRVDMQCWFNVNAHHSYRLSALSDVTMVDSKLESGLSTSIERFNFFFGVIIFWGSGESISCPSRKNSGLMGGLDISFLSYSWILTINWVHSSIFKSILNQTAGELLGLLVWK
jgi:hypothetical protein